MRATEEETLKKITLAAEMYYIYDMTQKDIARKLGVSRPWVSKLLDRAKELKIVRIEIDSQSAQSTELEQALEKKYDVQRVFVRNAGPDGDYSPISNASANYLISHIQEGDVIGVGWGKSIAATIDRVFGVNPKNVTVVSILGGVGSRGDLLGNVCSSRLATALGAHCELLHANAYCETEEEYNAIMSNQRVKSIIDLGEHADMVLVGIGNIGNSTFSESETDYISTRDRTELLKNGIVGDIALRFIDRGGNPADIDFNRRIIGCDLTRMRKNARDIIAVAYGSQKTDVIRAALKGGLITTLFTDQETAKKLG